MLKGLLCFVAGVYAGLYIDQKYKVPEVHDPAALYKAVTDYIEQFSKDGKDK
ncbi:hypothetical protein ACF0H5_023619 [Mactra antiquata]